MKVKIIKSVVSGNVYRNEGDIINLEGQQLKHYLGKGIAVEIKEEKAAKTTKENKTATKRTTKKAK